MGGGGNKKNSNNNEDVAELKKEFRRTKEELIRLKSCFDDFKQELLDEIQDVRTAALDSMRDLGDKVGDVGLKLTGIASEQDWNHFYRESKFRLKNPQESAPGSVTIIIKNDTMSLLSHPALWSSLGARSFKQPRIPVMESKALYIKDGGQRLLSYRIDNGGNKSVRLIIRCLALKENLFDFAVGFVPSDLKMSEKLFNELQTNKTWEAKYRRTKAYSDVPVKKATTEYQDFRVTGAMELVDDSRMVLRVLLTQD